MPTMFHYLMDLHYSQTIQPLGIFAHSFTTLWIYTILKRRYNSFFSPLCFTTLWIYTILKLPGQSVYHEVGFTTLWIYTILKQAHKC